MKPINNAVGWFEIPTIDMERAIEFYEMVMGYKLQRNQMGPLDMAFFPMVDKGLGSSGALVNNKENYRPSAEGILIYFSSPSGDIRNELARVKEAGGSIIRNKTLISEEIGFMGLFLDSEGNRIAMHSRK